MEQATKLRQQFGERAQIALAGLEITAHELASRSAMPLRRIEHILLGRWLRLTLRDMTIIAAVLGTPLTDLLGPLDTAVVVEALEIVD